MLRAICRLAAALPRCALTNHLPLNALAAVAAAAVLLAVAQAPALAGQPNIVFLYADDQAAWTVGATGNRQARTPSIDRLYKEGVALTNAFTTTPVCSPSRAGLMTAQYGTTLGITDYLNAASEPEKGLDPRLPTWPKLLQAAGYRTKFVGKWHLGALDRYLPSNFGYDSFYGFRTGASVSKDPAVESDGTSRVVRGFTPDILTDEAIRFVRASAGQGPFLVSLHFWAPHANTGNRTPDGDRTWLPLSPADWNPFRDLRVALPEPDYPDLDAPRARRMMAEYLGAVASLDRNVGRLLEVLDELGQADDTIVAFTSDHGFNMGHHGIWHKGNGRWLLASSRGFRSNLYDTSIRVPAVVRWPARLPAGETVASVVLNLDWFATLLDMAGIAIPQSARVHGTSFLPLLEGRKLPWRDSFYGEYSQVHQETVDQRMWRTPQWKLIRDSRPGMDELYNLLEDPGERRNLIRLQGSALRSTVARLDAALRVGMQRAASGP